MHTRLAHVFPASGLKNSPAVWRPLHAVWRVRAVDRGNSLVQRLVGVRRILEAEEIFDEGPQLLFLILVVTRRTRFGAVDIRFSTAKFEIILRLSDESFPPI